MVRDNARIVLTIGATVFVVVMAHCLTSRMTFKSAARLYLGELESKAAANGATLDLTAGGTSEVSSEIELLRSRSMVRRAVLASGSNVMIAPPGWKAPRFWHWLVSGRDPKLLDGPASQLAATETALAEGITLPRTYRVRLTSSTNYMLSGPNLAPVQGTLDRPLKTQDLAITLVAGRTPPRLGASFDVVVAPTEDVVTRAIEELSVTVPKSVSASETARVLVLEYASPSRRAAAAFLDQLMRGYLDVRQAWKTENATAAESFVTGQLHAMQQSLDRTQEKLAEFRAENPVVVLASEADAMVRQASQYEEQRIEATLQASAFRGVKRALKNPNVALEAHMFGEAQDVVLQQMATSLSESRETLSKLNGQYNSVAPEVKRQQELVQNQLETIRNYVDGRLSRAEQSVSALNNVIGDLESKLKTVPGAELKLTQIGRESEVYSRIYSFLLERQQQAGITKASTVSKNRVLDAPQVPLRENSPKLLLHLSSGILGLLLGAALVILRGLFSEVFRREHDVRVTLGGVQVFGRIPSRPPRQRTRTRIRGSWASAPLFDVMAPQGDASYAEAFRSLRTNLYRALPGEHGKVILISSPSAGDGKTTCALSLAAILAADNRRVLAIDTDVRRPTHHRLLGVPQEPGLRDIVLQSRGTWREAIRTMCLSVGWFDSISAGAEGNAELLTQGHFERFLTNARAHYDYIILDAPSYPTVSDSLALAPMSDFVLTVLRLGNTPRKVAEDHLSGLFVASHGYAVIVNGVDAPVLLRSYRPRMIRAERIN